LHRHYNAIVDGFVKASDTGAQVLRSEAYW
jgi:hypothetical protein